jgi:two-component system chemotaxis sensor kinase CheA
MITETSLNETFLTEFIDDLYAEYDERLGFIRRDLLALEAFVNQPNLDKSRLDALLRNLHTLKGLSGTINLKEAEQLAHQLENYLRALRQEQTSLSPEGMEALIAGVKILEQVIAAHQAQSSLPDTASVVAALTTVTAGTPVLGPAATTVVTHHITPPPNLTERESELFKKALEGSIPLWQLRFAPTPALAERGINVNSIRQRLEDIGTLIQAKPCLPTAGEGLTFEFLVATHTEEANFASWQQEGITYQRYEISPALHKSEAVPAPSVKPGATLSLITHSLVPSNVVRVDMARIDELMRLIGELVNSRARQENLFKQLKTMLPVSQWRALQETNLQLERQLRSLREGVMRVRMVPIGSAFERMRFVIRDLMSGTNKQVKLELSGPDTELDKLVVDQIIDPLLHLVRNAVSHGIETPEERLTQGKLPEGKIMLRAYTAGEAVVIEVEDDGHGIDLESVTTQAQKLAFINESASLNAADLLEILCKPGFSTQASADLTSGRGVGMDVVKTTVNSLGGFITLDTQVGKGSRFTIQLPLTLAIVDALIVSVNGQKFAVPQLAIREVIELDHTAVTALENNEIMSHRSGILVLVHLGRLFGLTAEFDKGNKGYVLIIGGSSGVGIVVDRLIGEQEIVVQAMNDSVVQITGIAGATELGDGKVVLILDVVALTNVGRKKLSAFQRT